jgi:membrane fusion protein (multidrug efflux system)
MSQPTDESAEAMAEEEEETSAVEAEAQEEQPPARRRLMRLAITILAIVVAIGGLWYYIYARNHESTDDAYIAGHLIQISPRVAAHVAVVHVTDNQWVKAGSTCGVGAGGFQSCP